MRRLIHALVVEIAGQITTCDHLRDLHRLIQWPHDTAGEQHGEEHRQHYGHQHQTKRQREGTLIGRLVSLGRLLRARAVQISQLDQCLGHGVCMGVEHTAGHGDGLVKIIGLRVAHDLFLLAQISLFGHLEALVEGAFLGT